MQAHHCWAPLSQPRYQPSPSRATLSRSCQHAITCQTAGLEVCQCSPILQRRPCRQRRCPVREHGSVKVCTQTGGTWCCSARQPELACFFTWMRSLAHKVGDTKHLMMASTIGDPLTTVAKPKCCQHTFQGSFVSVKPTCAADACNHCDPCESHACLSVDASCDLVLHPSASPWLRLKLHSLCGCAGFHSWMTVCTCMPQGQAALRQGCVKLATCWQCLDWQYVVLQEFDQQMQHTHLTWYSLRPTAVPLRCSAAA